MRQTTSQFLTAQFYVWEKRGRGWQVWNYPVELEPPFLPFPGYYLPTIDDGRKPTFLSALFERGKRINGLPEPEIEISEILSFYEQATPDLFVEDVRLIEFHFALPSRNAYRSESIEKFLQSLRIAKYPMAFELIGQAKSITLQMTCREPDSALVRANLRAYFPEMPFRETSGFLQKSWLENSLNSQNCFLVDFGLSHEFIVPLQADVNGSVDQLVGVITALEEIGQDEIAVLQVLFDGVKEDWADSALRATTTFNGDSMLENAPRIVDQLKQKIASPLFACVIRIGVKSRSAERTLELAGRLSSVLTTMFTNTANIFGNANELIPLDNDEYPDDSHEIDLLRRETHRSGMLLNSKELGVLVRPPLPSLRSDKFQTESTTAKSAPAIAVFDSSHPVVASGTVILGENHHQTGIQKVSLSNEQRSRHLYIIGSSGSGKSTLIANLITQDMQNGQGLCLLDPHGDLIDEVIANVPEHRLSDVILFDPSDDDFPVGFNILQANSELEKTLLASDLTATFRRMSTSWGDVMDATLANTVLAFVESTRGGSLFELKRFLVEKEFRRDFLESVADHAIRYFWTEEFPKLQGKPENAILIRLDTFLRQKLIRNIVCQKASTINLREVMDRRKILLVKLSQGAIGLENSFLLGTLLVAKINQIALSRQETDDRPFFSLYLDEFHNFVTPTIEMLLSGIRKYNVGLVLANQEYHQIASRSAEVANAVMANCYTRICFRLGDTDAQRFAHGFSFFNAGHLQNLGIGEAIARVERPEYDFNLKVSQLPKAPEDVFKRNKTEIIRLTRKKYATERSEVEKLFSFYQERTTQKTAVPEQTQGEQTRIEQDNAESAQTSLEPVKRESVLPGRHLEPPDSQHRYLQTIIKRIGEKNGFVATIEKQVFGGIGKIDVALEHDLCRIACEIALNNTPDYEVQNIQKCLASGFDRVLVISTDTKHLASIKKKVEAMMTEHQTAKIHFLEPENVHLFLEKMLAESESTIKETKIKGYKINVSFSETEKSDRQGREQLIEDLFKEARKRMK